MFQKIYIYFCLAVLLRVIFLFVLPPTQTPDESYIFQRTWATVTNSPFSDPYAEKYGSIYYPNNEYYFPPLYFFLQISAIKFFSIFHSLPATFATAYQDFYIPLRLISLALISVSLILVWKVLGRLALNQSIKISAFIFVSLLPTFVNFSIAANHNNLLFFFVTLIIFMLTGKTNPFLNLKKSALLGIIVGFALLTKFDALIIAPFIILKLLEIRNSRSLHKNAFVFIVAVIVCGGWWYLLNLANYGWFYNKSLEAATISDFIMPFSFPNYLLTLLEMTLITFFATFGIYNNIYIGVGSYALFMIFLNLSLIGLKLKPFLPSSSALRKIYFGLFLSFLLNIFMVLELNMFHAFQAQGRHLFPSLIFISLMFVTGISSIVGKKIAPYVPLTLLIIGIFLNYWSLGCVTKKFYNTNPLPAFLSCNYPSAATIPQTSFAPAFFKTFAHSKIVEPVVKTSSISKKFRPATLPFMKGDTVNAPLTLATL